MRMAPYSPAWLTFRIRAIVRCSAALAEPCSYTCGLPIDLRLTSIGVPRAGLCLAPDMPQHPRIILMHHPARQRQPIEHRLQPELVRGALDELGAAVRQRRKLEDRLADAEIAEDMRGVHVGVGTELAHGRQLVEHDERQLAVGQPLRDLLAHYPR